MSTGAKVLLPLVLATTSVGLASEWERKLGPGNSGLTIESDKKSYE
jgi:hypothetical protein